jgi:hypothetical protein
LRELLRKQQAMFRRTDTEQPRTPQPDDFLQYEPEPQQPVGRPRTPKAAAHSNLLLL